MRATAGFLVLCALAGFAAFADPSDAQPLHLKGYYELNKDKERVRIPGALDKFNLTSDDANAIIMDARVKAGWIEAPEVQSEPTEEPAQESA